MKKCNYYQYPDYYETDCGQQMDEQIYDEIEPDYCPWCGISISIQKDGE